MYDKHHRLKVLFCVDFITGTKILRQQPRTSSDCRVGGALLSKMAALLRAIVASWWNDASHSLRSVLELSSLHSAYPARHTAGRPTGYLPVDRAEPVHLSKYQRELFVLIVSPRCHLSHSENHATACGFFLLLLLAFVVVSWMLLWLPGAFLPAHRASRLSMFCCFWC